VLAVTASAPEAAHRGVTIGRARSGNGIAVATIPPLMADVDSRRAFARRQLAAVVDLYDRALCEPLPIACKATAAYARALRDGRDADAAAREEWEGTFNWSGEADEPEHVLAFGRGLSFEQLCRQDPRDDERGPGWEPEAATRFGRYAARMWGEILDVERLEER
jgi:exodeoxyribonuclease V gamma subunit